MQNGERAQSMLLVVVALSAVRTVTLDIADGSLRQFSLRRAACFGVLDDEEIIIIEGSCQFISIGCCLRHRCVSSRQKQQQQASDSSVTCESMQPSRSAAQRRRERRLRSMLRHERMSVAMALAEKLHHSAPRRPAMARARERGERDELYDATGQKTLPPGR